MAEKTKEYVFPDGARPSGRHVYVLSDGTAATAEAVLQSCLVQFPGVAVTVHKVPRIREAGELHGVMRRAVRDRAVVLFTFVRPELVQGVYAEGAHDAVPVIDLLGPVLARLGALLKVSPMGVPGLLRGNVDEEYFRRAAAIQFGMRHDDGLGLRTLHEADLVLLGPSRSSKTPVSIYLCCGGLKAANYPLIPGRPLPDEVLALPQGRVIGLIMDPDRLLELRKNRFQGAASGAPAQYVSRDSVRREIEHCRKVYSALGCPVVDVTLKSIEECAAEVLRVSGARLEAPEPA